MCPDLEISLLKTEEDFQRWLNYTLKPMKFEEFYRKGASACSDRPQVFNDVFDQTVFGYPEFVYNVSGKGSASIFGGGWGGRVGGWNKSE